MSVVYRVVPTLKYQVVRCFPDDSDAHPGMQPFGEFADMAQANQVAEALSEAEIGSVALKLRETKMQSIAPMLAHENGSLNT